MRKHITYSEYLHPILNPRQLQQNVDRAVDYLDLQFDAIAVRGNSGTIFGGALAYATGKPLILIRKPDSSSHSPHEVEGFRPMDGAPLLYVIVDDFVASGNTLKIVAEAVRKFYSPSVCVGVYQYTRNKLWTSCDTDEAKVVAGHMVVKALGWE